MPGASKIILLPINLVNTAGRNIFKKSRRNIIRFVFFIIILILLPKIVMSDEVGLDVFIHSKDSNAPYSIKSAVRKIKDLKIKINRPRLTYESEDAFKEKIAKNREILDQFLAETFVLVCSPSNVNFLKNKKRLRISYELPLAVARERNNAYVIESPVSEHSGRLYAARDQMLKTFIYFKFINEETIKIDSVEVYFYEELLFSD